MKFSEIFSGSDTSSYGRILSAISALFLLVWVSALFYKAYTTKTFSLAELKSAIPDVPAGWVTIIVAPYGISKGLATIGDMTGNKQ